MNDDHLLDVKKERGTDTLKYEAKGWVSWAGQP